MAMTWRQQEVVDILKPLSPAQGKTMAENDVEKHAERMKKEVYYMYLHLACSLQLAAVAFTPLICSGA